MMGYYRTMPSNSDAILRSVRRWLLVAVFLLGVGVIALADIAYNVSGSGSGPIPAAVGVTGGLIALIAGIKALGTLSDNP
jgi:peptidoglycan/LPS O-acetylase OafA/YrhL